MERIQRSGVRIRSPFRGFLNEEGPESPVRVEKIGNENTAKDVAVFPQPDVIIDIPQHVEDPYYFGLDLETNERCFHDEVPERKVAFDMAATGRRFLGCARKGDQRCRFVYWVDDPWNPVLTRALLRLWNLGVYRWVNGIPSSSAEIIASSYKTNIARIVSDVANKETLQELKLKIGLMETRLIRSLSSQTNVCVSAISVVVTLAFVFLLGKI